MIEVVTSTSCDWISDSPHYHVAPVTGRLPRTVLGRKIGDA